MVFAEPRARLRGTGPASATNNVLNRKPLTTVCLRLFDNQARTRDFLREAGHVLKVRDPYGSCPVRSVLCHGSFWRMAVALLPAGAVLLCDASSNRAFLEAQIR